MILQLNFLSQNIFLVIKFSLKLLLRQQIKDASSSGTCPSVLDNLAARSGLSPVRAAFAKSDTGADQKSGTADTGLFIWSLIKSASYKLVNLFDLLFTKLL